MRKYPAGGMIGKAVRLLRWMQSLQIPLHAANACYFMVLAIFPALLLLLGLLRDTPLEVERLPELLYGLLPEALAVSAEELILLTWDSTSGAIIGISAITALWSASRGIHALLTGLNAVYGVTERRGYFRARLLSMAYLFAFLVMLLLTLWLHIFRTDSGTPVLPHLRFWGPLLLRTVFFVLLYRVLPEGRRRLREELPGAILASLGWQLTANLYSLYAVRFSLLKGICGSVYAVALSMLWLYCCVSILFWGGALNVLLTGKNNMSEP